MKLFKTSDMEIVKCCQSAFNCVIPSVQIAQKSEKFVKQVRKVLWTRKGVRATVVTAGHCRHAELTSVGMLWLAVTAVACTSFRVCAN